MKNLAQDAVALALLVFTAGSAIAAGTPDQSCRGGKLGAAGKYAAALLTCESKAAREGAAADPTCLAKAATKFADSFAGAETKTGVSCNGLASITETMLEETVEAVQLAVPVPGGGGLCASLALKSTGKFASAFLGAWSKFVTSEDLDALEAAEVKARATLQKSIAKAESKAGCAGSGQYEAARAAVEDTVEGILSCIGSSSACVEAADDVDAGETVTTDPTDAGPTVDIPLTSSVETPNPGTVVLRITEAITEPPIGYSVLGQEVEVTAPDATASSPLVLTFVVDASLLPPDPNTVELMRNGVVIPDCTGAPGVADPDPCLYSRILLGSGDLELVALSSQASVWSPVVAASIPANCPMSMVWKQRADTGSTTTASELDLGWSGFTHDLDPVDGARMAFCIDCDSPVPDGDVCEVTGFDPTGTACRCASDTRTSCDEPNVADADDCGGSVCQCYTAPPTPIYTGGTPACLLRKATALPTGTWNRALGAGSITHTERTQIYLGMDTLLPCASCSGDAVANDGIRGGTCSGGASDGLSCDANGTDPTYFAAGHAASYDCLPSNGNNISGLGILMARTETTGSVSLASGLDCAGNPFSESCPCAVCSGNTSVGCSSDSDCAAISAGTCTSIGSSGATVRPDDCSTSCVAGVGGEGTCDLDFDSYCDGVLEEDGRGIVACSVDEDCEQYLPAFDFGQCTIQQPRPCFPSPIQATGVEDAALPRTVAAFCMASTSNSGVNQVLGLPGPARMRTDWEVTILE